MLRTEDVSINQTVFFIEPWGDSVTRATVTEVHEKYAEVKCHCVVDSEDNEVCKTYGSCSQPYEKLFDSAAHAYATKRDVFAKQVDTYCNEITSIKDLMLFALSHNISGCDECWDYAAREAYKRRGKEVYQKATGGFINFPE